MRKVHVVCHYSILSPVADKKGPMLPVAKYPSEALICALRLRFVKLWVYYLDPWPVGEMDFLSSFKLGLGKPRL
jgi:hypothetical protein